MLTQTITVNLPDSLYRQVAQRAERTHSSLEEELLAVLASALSNTEELPTETSDALAQLAYLNDEELWQAAQVSLSPEENMRMQTLLLKRQAEGLTRLEQEEAEQLLRHSEHIMLLRAQAMALLHERGHNVAQLLYPSIDQ
jgi:plasmid stability protein